MLAAIATSPATYFLAGVIGLSAVLPRLGLRVWRLSPMAFAAVAMYVISTAIITSYRSVPGDWQVVWWTTSLLAVSLLYIAILFVRTRNSGNRLVLVWLTCAVALFAGALTDDHSTHQKLLWFGQYGFIAVLAFFCYMSTDRDDLAGSLTWGVLFVAEGMGAAQVVDCQMLHGMIDRPITEGSACSQVYAWVGTAYLPTVLPALVMAWILYRCLAPKAK